MLINDLEAGQQADVVGTTDVVLGHQVPVQCRQLHVGASHAQAN